MKRRAPTWVLAQLVLSASLACGIAHGQENQETVPATLEIWNRPIATFRAPVGGVPPDRRAVNARARIDALPRESEQADITIHPGRIGADEGLMLAVGGRVVFGFVPGDLDPESATTLSRAAAAAGKRLEELLDARAAQRDVRATMIGIAYSLLTLIAFVLAVRLVMYLREAAVGKLTAVFSRRRLSIGGLDLTPTLESVERATFRVVGWAMILAMAYLGLTFVFHQFPLTEPLGERLGDYLAAQLLGAARSVALALPSLIGVAAVILVTRAIALWVSRVLVEIEHGAREVAWLEKEQARATRRIASGIVWMLGIATAYPLLPWSDSLAFQGMSVVLGLAVSFASGGLINHWVSGLMILYSRSLRVGEFVAVGEVEGVVTELGALATKLRTMRREEVSIPNAVIASDKLVNFTRLAAEGGALLATWIAIGYDAAWHRVRRLLLEAAATTPGVASEPAPRVLPWELAEFYVRYQLHVHLAPGADRVAVRAELNARILDVFTAAGVQIMVPHYESQPERPVIAPADRSAA